MALSLSSADFSELVYDKPTCSSKHNQLLAEFELLYEVPSCIGQGYIRQLELHPGVELEIWNYEYHDDLTIKALVHDHWVQFLLLSFHAFSLHPGGCCA